MSKTDPKEVSKTSPRRPAKKKAVTKRPRSPGRPACARSSNCARDASAALSGPAVAPTKPHVKKAATVTTMTAPSAPKVQTVEQSQSAPEQETNDGPGVCSPVLKSQPHPTPGYCPKCLLAINLPFSFSRRWKPAKRGSFLNLHRTADCLSTRNDGAKEHTKRCAPKSTSCPRGRVLSQQRRAISKRPKAPCGSDQGDAQRSQTPSASVARGRVILTSLVSRFSSS